MSTTVAGKVMPIIAVGSVDQTRDFYVDTLGFTHMMGVVGKDGQLDFCSVLLGDAQVMFTRGPSGGAGGRVRRRRSRSTSRSRTWMHSTPGCRRRACRIVDPLTLQWWGDRTFKVRDPNGYVLWFYTNVAEPKPPQGMKVV